MFVPHGCARLRSRWCSSRFLGIRGGARCARGFLYYLLSKLPFSRDTHVYIASVSASEHLPARVASTTVSVTNTPTSAASTTVSPEASGRVPPVSASEHPHER